LNKPLGSSRLQVWGDKIFENPAQPGTRRYRGGIHVI